jgi:hypothetical protein
MFDRFLRTLWAPAGDSDGGGGTRETHFGSADFSDKEGADEDDEEDEGEDEAAEKAREAAEKKEAARERRQRELEADLAAERREKAGLLQKLNEKPAGKGKKEEADDDTPDLTKEGDDFVDELAKLGSGGLKKFIAKQIAAGVQEAIKDLPKREDVGRMIGGTLAEQREQAAFKADFPLLSGIYDDISEEKAASLLKDPRYKAFVEAMNEAPDQSMKSTRLAAKLVMAQFPEKKQGGGTRAFPSVFRGSGAGADFTEQDDDDLSPEALEYGKGMGHSAQELRAFKKGGAAGLAKLMKAGKP